MKEYLIRGSINIDTPAIFTGFLSIFKTGDSPRCYHLQHPKIPNATNRTESILSILNNGSTQRSYTKKNISFIKLKHF